MLSGDAYITISNGAYLVIDNETATGILENGAGGNIVCEGETNFVRWMVNEGTDTYTVPFATYPSPNGTGTKIPLTINVTAAGAALTTPAEMGINFTTFPVANSDNTPYPAIGPVQSMNDMDGNDISLSAVDRFWIIDRDDYFTSPSLQIDFGYDDDPSQIGGSNSIAEFKLQGFAYDEQNDMWGDINLPLLGQVQTVSGTADTVANLVSSVVLDANAVTTQKIWTLAEGDVVDPNCEFNAYKMFSPDGDGKNDTWIIDCIDRTPNNTISIVNRWGDEVANFTGYDNNSIVWDGTNKGGEQLAPGTYFYMISLEDSGETHSGWVHIVY